MTTCEHRRAPEPESSSIMRKNFLLSKDPSLGACSSRIYYSRSVAEGVPFQWEMQPGTPKHPPREDPRPPLSPPPALLSLGLPKPCIPDEPPAKPRFGLRLIRFLVKKSKRRGPRAKGSRSDAAGWCSDKDQDRFDFCSSDGEFMASPAFHSSSSSPSSLSLSNGFSRQSSRLQSPPWNPATTTRSTLSCSPGWDISSFLVKLSKRI